MKVTVSITGLGLKTLQNLAKLKTSGQFKQAMAGALNDSAYAAQKVIRKNMATSFQGGVTPYLKNTILVKPATPENLSAWVGPTYLGGKAVDPQNILFAEVFGGGRRFKRSERALQRIGVLPAGYMTVPGKGCPADKIDAYGNVKGSFLVQLLSYFQAFGEQGYRANMTDKRKRQIAKFGKSANGYKTINGAIYFVSLGQLPGGKGVHDAKNRTRHLAPGIYSKTGIHGSNVKPVLMFVRPGNYQKRLDVYDTPVQAARDAFERRLRYQTYKILEGKP